MASNYDRPELDTWVEWEAIGTLGSRIFAAQAKIRNEDGTVRLLSTEYGITAAEAVAHANEDIDAWRAARRRAKLL